MELAVISAADAIEVAEGNYRLGGEGWSVDVAAASAEDAKAAVLAAYLGAARDAKVAEIKAALAASDVWACRHIEDGASLTEARVAYREQLRILIGQAAASDDPASISLPQPPSFP